MAITVCVKLTISHYVFPSIALLKSATEWPRVKEPKKKNTPHPVYPIVETSTYRARSCEFACYRNDRGKNRKLRPRSRSAKNRVNTWFFFCFPKTTGQCVETDEFGLRSKGTAEYRTPPSPRPGVTYSSCFFPTCTYWIFSRRRRTNSFENQKKPQIHTKVPGKRLRYKCKMYFM